MEQKKGAVEFGETIQLRGCYEIALQDAKGRVLDYQRIDNVVVTAGRSYVLQMMLTGGSQVTTGFQGIEVGTSTTAPATGDTLLNGTFATASAGSGRLAIGSFVTTGLSANPPSWQAQVTFATNQSNTTLGEAGLFNATGYNVQTMLSHVTFATINKTTSNTLAISYTISN